MKKIISFLMAAILVIAMGSSVCLAVETTDKGTISIDHSIDGTVYNAYKLLDLTVHGSGKNLTYTYKPADKLDAFFNQADVKEYFVFENNGTITAKETLKKDGQKFITILKKFLAAHTDILPVGSATAKDSIAKIENLPLGYYFVDTTMGSMCLLQSVSKDVTLTEKNDIPSIEKDVNDNGTWKKSNDATIGDKVEFKTTVKVVYGATNYKVIDNLSEGLTYNDTSIKVMDGEKDITEKCEFTFVKETNSFTLTIPDDILPIVKKGEPKDLIITYSATLNDNAIVDGPSINKTQLSYGKDSKTNFSETKTYTYKLNVYKFGVTNNEETPLSGAEFKLSTDKAGNDIINFKKVTDAIGGTYKVTASSDSNDYATLTSDDGYIYIQGLDVGTYYLTETKAPDGYNLLTKPFEVKIDRENPDADADGIFTVSNSVVMGSTDEPLPVIKIENKGGTELPETGGIGTTIFYVLGGLLMVGAVVILVTKKKLSMMEE